MRVWEWQRPDGGSRGYVAEDCAEQRFWRARKDREVKHGHGCKAVVAGDVIMIKYDFGPKGNEPRYDKSRSDPA